MRRVTGSVAGIEVPAGRRGPYLPGMQQRWEDPAWIATAHGWIADRLAELGLTRTGEIEQPHVRDWATAMRVPTDAGDVWFKANTEALAFEAGLVSLLAERRPDVVPPLLAADPASGWMLMSDAGPTLRTVEPEEAWLDVWRDVLPRYAELQVALTEDVETLLALGVPDLRLATLPERYERLVDQVGAERRFLDALPLVVDLRDRLAAYGIGETVQHDDLHDGQIFVRDGGFRVLDWGDACVAHPFFTLSVSLEGILQWGLHDVEGAVDVAPYRDGYLAPFAAAYPGVDVVEAVEPALRLGWVCRAVNGHLLGGAERTMTRLRMFLDGTP
jgi:hypothetical protein